MRHYGILPQHTHSSQNAKDCASISRVLTGDVDAYEAIVRHYQNMVAKIANRHVPRHAVEEICQDTFIRAYKSLATFRGKEAFSHWLAKITTRACHDHWRTVYKNREDTLTSINRGTEEWVERTLDAHSQREFEEQTHKDEAKETLNMALDHLSPQDRMVITLTHREGHSVHEAADLLGWSTANVKVRAFRARKKLKNILEKIVEGEEE